MRVRLHSCSVLLALVVAGVAAAAVPAGREAAAGAALDRLVEGYWQEHLRLRPVHATLMGDHRYDELLPNNLSDAHLGLEYALEKRSLAALAAIDAATLSPAERLTYDAFKWDRELEIEGYRYPAELMPIGPSGGIPQLMAQFGSGAGAQPFANVNDYDHWLRRLESYVVWLDQATANLRRGLSRGYVLPRVVVERTLSALEGIAAADPAQSLFLRPVASFPAAVSTGEQARLRDAYRRVVSDGVNPAYRRLIHFLRQEYLPRARATIGWAALPQGREWYRYRLRRATTTALSADEIHQLGLDEVRRIGADLDRVISDTGFKGDRRGYFDALRTDPRAYFDREEDLLLAVAALKTRVRARLTELVDPLPRADFEIRAVDPARAAGLPAAWYRPASTDATRPGIYYVNTSELKSRPRCEQESLYLHEAEPGHRLQLELQQERSTLPSFRRFGGYLAFVEGWSLYAEALGRDLGLYADLSSAAAALSSDLTRANRLVIDTGIHAGGWSRQQALEYLQANSTLAAVDAASEVDRVIANPGQALAYKVGELRLRALRAHVGQALGPRFDLRAFHRELLGNGALPFEVLEASFERWLAAQKAAP